MNITILCDCGHAPKKLFLKDLNIAFMHGDINYVQDCVTDDIIWDLVGVQKVEGKEAFITSLEEMKNANTTALTLVKIVTHGKDAAAYGIIEMTSGETYRFSDFYEFSGAKGTKVKKIVSFVIKER